MAVVCAALGAVAVAQPSDRRKVAVVALSPDEAAKQLRIRFYDALQVHWALRSLGNASLDAALEGPFLDEDRQHLDAARTDLQQAEDALARFDYPGAIQNANGARQELTWVTPTVALPVYTDATLALGQALLGSKQTNAARQEFVLVHRLDPLRQLDPGRYLPEIVEFYTEAKPSGETVKLQVIGHGHAWIDGVERGTAPATFDVGAGEHLVQLTGADRITRGDSVAADKTSVEIPDQAALEELKVQRARVALANTPDPAARAGRMQELAKLLDVHDAVLIDMRGGALAVQTWRDRAPGFSDFVAYRDQAPAELLAPLAPPKPPEEPKLAVPFTPPPKIPEQPWWQQRWVQGSAAIGATIVVVGIVLYATRDTYVPFPGGTTYQPPPTSAR